MARPRGTETYVPEANIWPAVTDSILLMASIFIVLAVASLVAIVQKIDDQAGAGKEPGEKLICTTVALSAEFLFDPGKSNFKNSGQARKELITQLKKLGEGIDGVKRYARAQKDWSQGYYLVLEVSGHTDLDPLASAEWPGGDGNWELSGQRAITVTHELESIFKQSDPLHSIFDIRLGSSSTASSVQARPGSAVLRVAGYSSHLPVTNYKDIQLAAVSEKVKQMNRRVELRLYAQPTYIVKATISP